MIPSCQVDRSTLESLIASLNSCSDALDSWLSLWIALVVVGLLLEIALIVAEHRDGIKAWKRATIRSPERPTIRELVFHLSGAALIAVGVAGEFAAHFEAGKINTDLRIANSELVARKDRETVASLTEAKRETAEARLETARIVARLSARHVSVKQQQRISERLSGFRGQSLLLAAAVDDETSNFVSELRRALNGIDVTVIPQPRDSEGVVIWAGANRKAFGVALQEALVSEEVLMDTPEVRLERMGPDQIMLSIGRIDITGVQR